MKLGYWSGFGPGYRPYQFSIVDYLPRWMSCGGWRGLFSVPIPGDRVVTFWVPNFTNWRGVPERETPDYPWPFQRASWWSRHGYKHGDDCAKCSSYKRFYTSDEEKK